MLPLVKWILPRRPSKRVAHVSTSKGLIMRSGTNPFSEKGISSSGNIQLTTLFDPVLDANTVPKSTTHSFLSLTFCLSLKVKNTASTFQPPPASSPTSHLVSEYLVTYWKLRNKPRSTDPRFTTMEFPPVLMTATTTFTPVVSVR